MGLDEQEDGDKSSFLSFISDLNDHFDVGVIFLNFQLFSHVPDVEFGYHPAHVDGRTDGRTPNSCSEKLVQFKIP